MSGEADSTVGEHDSASGEVNLVSIRQPPPPLPAVAVAVAVISPAAIFISVAARRRYHQPRCRRCSSRALSCGGCGEDVK